MRKILKKIIATVLCAVMILGIAPLNGFVGLKLPEINLPKLNLHLPELKLPDFSALFTTRAKAEDATSGACGDNLTWEYDENTQALTISGTGEMYDYDYGKDNPMLKHEIKSVVIQDEVTSVGAYAFAECVGLTSITIPDSVTSIGDGALGGCSELTSITIPSGVTSIGDIAFYGCVGLTSITIPDSVTSIGAYAFAECTGLTSITIPDSVTSIGAYAFAECTGLTSITIPDSVTSIGAYAFAECTGLTSITIPDSVTSIGEGAFSGCTGLTSIAIPESVTSIGSGAFSGCTGLENITVESSNPIYYSTGNCLIATEDKILITGCKNSIIPADGSVKNIGEYAFGDCTGLTSITIPDGVTSIGSDAFRYCTGLTSITIPDSVTSIGDWTFRGCTGLTSITIPYNVTSIGNWTFDGCTGLTSITIPDSVTSIGDYAFTGCTGLTSITIPNSVTSIGEYAFSGCTGLTSITIPDNVTSIGDRAFRNCTGLTSITIPDNVTSIGYWTFDGCTELTDIFYQGTEEEWNAIEIFDESIKNKVIHCSDGVIDLSIWNYYSQNDEVIISGCNKPVADIRIPGIINGKPVKYIGGGAFRDCTELTSITIPDSVTSIRESAFENCTGLTSITIPDGVTSIGNWTFRDCTGLTSITIPDSVTSIGSGVFENCTGLTSITIPSSVTSIGYRVFSNCAGLTSITIPSSVTSIGKSAFENCTGLTDIFYLGTDEEWNAIKIFDESIKNIVIHCSDGVIDLSIWNYYFQNDEMIISGCNKPVADIRIPGIINGKPVKYIGDGAFRDCTGLTSIAIPDSVTSICNWTFSGCSGLTSIEIPESVTSIGAYAFAECTGLTSITIPDSVTSIGEGAFYGCTGLTSITIPDNVTSIGDWTFSGCSGMTSITIPDGVTSIGNCTFDGCAGLTSITIPDSVTSIGEAAFGGCSELTNIEIPSSVTSIGGYAFSGCTGLISITIPDSVTRIGDWTFRDCTGLTSITIPSSVTSIGEYAFSGCTGLTSIEIPDSVTSIGESAFYGCTGLTSITILDSVTSIGEGAFYGCTGLTSITIPDSVTSMGDWTFDGCAGLTSITIPDSVTSIGEGAFYGCTGLTDIFYQGTEEDWNAIEIFDESIKNIVIHCSDGVIDLSIWNYYFQNDEVVISGCNKPVADITIPGMINGKPVKYIGEGAFSGCTGLTSITIPDGVTSIGNCTFDGCTGLTSIAIPESVTSIGSGAFSGCTGLTSITIPDSVTSIGNSAFYGCTGLTSITIPDSVTRIGAWTFRDCTGLTSIEIPSSVTSIGEGAFQGCTGLTSITIPDGVTSIGNYAFYECAGLTSITIPDNVTSIGESAFSECAGLTSITIPNSVTSIGEYAFSGCTGLTSITIPDSITRIGDWTFRDCTELTSITIPDSVTSIGEGAFSGYTGLTDIFYQGTEEEWNAIEIFDESIKNIVIHCSDGVIDLSIWNYYFQNDEVVISGCNKPVADITIPGMINGKPVKRIGDKAFSSCDGLTSITIPDSVASIGNSAFYGCTGLTSITIPSSVTSIGNSAFYGCTGLTSITIPDSVTSIDSGAFENCTGLTSITIPSSVTSIGYRVFSNCAGLTSITIPDNVTSIGDYAFYGCTGLTSITIPSSVTSIGDYAFYGCTGLTSITIPDSVTSIGGSAFSGCAGLTSITIPDSITRIGDWTFRDCTGLTSITIPDNVTSIGDYAFYGCTGLTSITIPDGVTSIGEGAFAVCKGLISITMPDSVKIIGFGAFNGCTGLTSITIPDRVTDIGGFVFNNCARLMNINIPDSVTNIGLGAFSGCKSLISITIPDSVTSIGAWAFDGCTGLTSITIPSSVTNIGSLTFNGCNSIKYIHFKGNEVPSDCNFLEKCKNSLEVVLVPYDSYSEYVNEFDDYIDPSIIYYSPIQIEPKSFEGHSDESGSVNLTWEKHISDEIVSYVIERDGEVIKTTEDLSFVDTGLQPIEYNYTVYGVTADNQQTASATITVSLAVPEKIINVSSLSDYDSITVSWSQSSEVNSTTYNIYRKAENEDEYRLIGSVNGRNKTSFKDTSAEEETNYSYYVTVQSIYGVSSVPSEKVTAVREIDTEAPVIIKLTPSDCSIISGTTAVTVNATDNYILSHIVMSYSADNGETWEEIGTDNSSPYKFNVNTNDLPDGNVLIKAVAYDKRGNESEPEIYSYTIDNTGPDKVTGVESISVLTTVITLQWNDAEADDIACFVLQRKQGENFVTISSSITTLGYNVTGLTPDTEYTFRVAGMDIRGNIGEYSDEFTVSTAHDDIAPVITSQSPAPGRYSESIPFSVTASDDYGIREIEIQVSTDKETWDTIQTKTYSSEVATRTYSYNVGLEDYEDGSLYVRAVATDFSDNVSDTSDAAPWVEYFVDHTAPGSPQNLAAAGGEKWIYISWLQGEEADLATYSLYRSTEEDSGYTLIKSNLASTSYYDEDVELGVTYYYKLRVLDSVGNLSDFTGPVSARLTDDATPPEIISINPASGSTVGKGYKTVNVYARDNFKVESITIEYKLSEDDEYDILSYEEGLNSEYVNVSAELPVTGLDNGDTVYVRAKVADAAGLESAYSSESVYTIDKTAPEVKNIEIAIEGDNVVIRWNDSGEEDLSGFKVYRITSNGNSYLGSRAVSSKHSYTFKDFVYSSGNGYYSYIIEAIDKNGNGKEFVTESVYYEHHVENKAPIAVIEGFTVMEIGVEEYFDAGYSSDDNGIVSYYWDFGDGTSSEQVKPIKKYLSAGEYTVTLTVTDADGLTDIDEMKVTVRERSVLGTLNVTVKDDDGKAVSNAPVYFDLGESTQKIVYTNSSGVASLVMSAGDHIIGVYKNEYLPVQKTVTVQGNTSRNIELTIVKQEIVTGDFEVHRMTFDEIVAAGIDVYDPANQNVYQVEVTVSYGDEDFPITYYRNDEKIISYTVGNWGGSGGSTGGSGGSSNNKKHKIANVTYVPNDYNQEVLAVLTVPFEATYLKEFFDVKLHIINHADSDFSITNSNVNLIVPEGLTMMTNLRGDWCETPNVNVGTIAGQETKTISWVLRGDTEGLYDLSADFSGTLAKFNAPVYARFTTDEPIRVYGLSNMKIIVEIDSEVVDQTFHFNIGLENIGDVDIYNPTLDFNGIVENITHSYMVKRHAKNPNQYEINDFNIASHLTNVRIDRDGQFAEYIEYDNQGSNIYTAVESLAPKEAVFYEFTAFDVSSTRLEVMEFESASAEVLQGLSSNVEIRFINYAPLINSKYSQVHTVSNYVSEYLSYRSSYPGVPMDGTKGNPDYCVPGLSEDDGMVPQGLTYLPSRNWILISAYDKNGNDGSVIFAIDATSGKFVAQYNIMVDKNTPSKAHLGGIAVTDNNLYLTRGNQISYIPLSKLKYTGEPEDIVISGSFSLSSLLGKADAAYLSFGDGCLWTGNFYQWKDYPQKASKDNNSLLLGFKISGENSTDEWNNLTDSSKADYTYNVPNNINKIQWATVDEGRMFINTSYGRKNDSTLYVYDISLKKNIETINSEKDIQVRLLPMAEGMFIKDNCLYSLYESGSSKYLNGAKNPSDVIWKVSINKEESNTSLTKKVTYTTDNGHTSSFDVVYDKQWFVNDNRVYNHDLARFCADYAMMGYTGRENEHLFADNLRQFGFNTNPNYINFHNNQETNRNEVNYFIAHKNETVNGEDITVVFAGFIGSDTYQWYSNFDPNGQDRKNNTHANNNEIGTVNIGFADAREYAIKRLRSYYSDNSIDKDKVKLVLTGHSRGAATANLLAAKLLNSLEFAGVNSIYTYTFATPNPTTDNNIGNYLYKCIFNIVNPEDFVTKVMLQKWGYGRYGVTYTLPSKTNDVNFTSYYSKVSPLCSKYKGAHYVPYKHGEISTASIIGTLGLSVPSVNMFYSYKVPTSVGLMAPFDFFKSTLLPIVSKLDYAGGLLTIASILLDLKPTSNLYKLILMYFLDPGADLASAVELSANIQTAIDNKDIEYLLSTLPGLLNFTQAHQAETYCAYMNALSKYDIKVSREGLQNIVNCPVDIEVYDNDSEEIVGRITNNVVDETIASKDNSIVMTVNGDSKEFWLPSNGDYRVILTGNDEGAMDYTVAEIDSDCGEQKRVNFFNVSIQDEVSMTGDFSDDLYDLKEYSLTLEDGNSLEPTEIISDMNVERNINVTVEGAGYASESTTVIEGDYVTLSSFTPEGSTFLGWYENEKLISEETELSFVAKSDRNLTAKFAINSYTVTWNVNGEEIVREVAFSQTIEKPAEPYVEGYNFKGWTPEIPETMPAENLIFYAVFEPITYYATFMADSKQVGDKIPFTVESLSVTAPAVPAKEGYTGKWSAYTLKASDITIQAIYEKIPNPTADAKLNVKSSSSVDYRANVTITATATDVPVGYVLALYDGNARIASGDNTKVSHNVGNLTASKTYTVKVIDPSNNAVQKDSNGSELSKTCEVKVNSGFFAKLIAFFKGLFGLLPKVEIKP